MKVIEISPKTIINILVVITGIYLLIVIKDLLFSLLIALILLSALNPAVEYLEQREKWNRKLAINVVFFGFVGIFVGLITYILPVFIKELTSFIQSLPTLVKSLGPNVNSIVDLQSLTSNIPNVANQAITILSGVASNIVFLISTLFFTYYFLTEEHTVEDRVKEWLPKKYHTFFLSTFKLVQKRMSGWFWGEITLMAIIGLATFVLLSVLGVKYALPLAVIAGLLELIPTVGPILSAVPAVLVTLSKSELLFAVIIGYIVIQQLENNFIVPQVMKKAVGMSPIFILCALFTGGRIAGVLGVLLALPIALLLQTITLEWFKHFPLERLENRE